MDSNSVALALSLLVSRIEIALYYVLSRLHYLSKFQELFCFVRFVSAAKIDAAHITRRLINQRVHVPTLDSITNKWKIKVY